MLAHTKKPMPMSLLPKPVNVILSGKCVFADVIQLKISRWDHPEYPGAPNPVTSVLMRNRRGQRPKEETVKIEAQTRMMPAAARSWESQGTEPPPRAFGRNAALPAFLFQISGPQKWERINSVVLRHQVCSNLLQQTQRTNTHILKKKKKRQSRSHHDFPLIFGFLLVHGFPQWLTSLLLQMFIVQIGEKLKTE